MRRLGPGAHVFAVLAIGAVLVAGGLAPNVRALGPDRSDVVIVLDFSASILKDARTRDRFAAAIERIADRVDETAADLVAGDVTVSIVRFATKAADYPGCADLKLLDSPPAVSQFANCLRSVAAAYRKGVRVSLTKAIGVDTNYVAAMEQAAKHLPPDAIRPAMILFTDGKHDVRGVPVSQVPLARDRLFGARSPFALLPVGMGLDPKERGPLANGLESMKVIRDMPACVSGALFDWPTVVFESADEAGNAVAVALQDATCTFTVAPTPTPTPAPTPAAVRGIRLTPGDTKIDIAWAPASGPTASAAPVTGYSARCRTGDGDWVESTGGVSPDPKATVEGLINGIEYRCEVAAIGPSGTGVWTAAGTPVTPIGRPPAPAKPSVAALNHGVRIGVTPLDGLDISGYHFECSTDNGASWPVGSDAGPDTASAVVANLTNGTDYLCRAFAENPIGTSDASPISDYVRPCSTAVECNARLLPILAILGLLGIGGLLVGFFVLWRGRTTGYVVAVVDVVHTANIGHGSTLGISFVRDVATRRITGIVAEKGSHADVRIRRLRGGRFRVRDRTGKHVVNEGEAVIVADSVGVKHALVLRAFATNAASAVASRR